MAAPILTQERLKELLHYNPDSGIFTRIVATCNTVKVGDIAGHVDGQGYCKIWFQGRLCKAHRLAFLYMDGAFPPNEVDHIDGNPSNNRWTNLRAVTRGENRKNVRLLDSNTSGVVGVYWKKDKNKWQAAIKTNGKMKHLGYFNCFENAVSARKLAENIYGFHPNHGRS